MKTLTIGQLGKATATKIETIRYYEKIDLLPAPDRTSGNYRSYAADIWNGSASSGARGSLDSRSRTCVNS
jgi:hypothetical protein